MKCKNCYRFVPNIQHFTKNGCVACDAQYHRNKAKREIKNTNKTLNYKILYIINKNRGKPNFDKKTIEQIREVVK